MIKRLFTGENRCEILMKFLDEQRRMIEELRQSLIDFDLSIEEIQVETKNFEKKKNIFESVFLVVRSDLSKQMFDR